VGFDDIPTAQYVAPPLTTVRVPARKLGHRTMQRLLARIDGDPIDDPLSTLDTTLVIRRSCGCAGV
jgi:LacI family transcriptional regulator